MSAYRRQRLSGLVLATDSFQVETHCWILEADCLRRKDLQTCVCKLGCSISQNVWDIFITMCPVMKGLCSQISLRNNKSKLSWVWKMGMFTVSPGNLQEETHLAVWRPPVKQWPSLRLSREWLWILLYWTIIIVSIPMSLELVEG